MTSKTSAFAYAFPQETVSYKARSCKKAEQAFEKDVARWIENGYTPYSREWLQHWYRQDSIMGLLRGQTLMVTYVKTTS